MAGHPATTSQEGKVGLTWPLCFSPVALATVVIACLIATGPGAVPVMFSADSLALSMGLRIVLKK